MSTKLLQDTHIRHTVEISESESSDSSSLSTSTKQVKKKTNKLAYDAVETKYNDEDPQVESKGLLGKIVQTAKDAVTTKEKAKPKIVETEVIIELPRDILTAFFLLRLPRDESRNDVEPGTEKNPMWNDYSLFGKIMLWISVLIPYFVQWFVLFNLVQELITKWDVLKSDDAQDDFWYNTVAFGVLFLYMWKDLVVFYSSVWRYISYLQHERGGILTNLKDAAVAAKEAAVEKAKEVTSTQNVDEIDRQTTKEIAKEAAQDTKTAIQFIEFKLWLVSVLLLYFGLTCYSLLSIPLEETLVDKLGMSLSVFFVLEVDDWAYELFIAQANILEDEEFDVVIKIKKDRKTVIKEQQKHLARTLILVNASICAFWIIGWGLTFI